MRVFAGRREETGIATSPPGLSPPTLATTTWLTPSLVDGPNTQSKVAYCWEISVASPP